MDIPSALLVYALIWVVVFLVVLQAGPGPDQGDPDEEGGEGGGKVVPGTPASAPRRFDMKRKLRLTTLIALVVWAAVAWVVTSGVVTLDDLDIVKRFGPGASR